MEHEILARMMPEQQAEAEKEARAKGERLGQIIMRAVDELVRLALQPRRAR